MTALKEYARLESTGLWRATPEDQRREVGLSFGEATLVITDSANRPLTHWSLPAISRINPGKLPALFTPDPDGTETLEIEDDTMIDAIEQVRRSLARARPRPGRLRQSVGGLVLLTCLGLGVFWLPGALTRQTLSVVPPVKRSEIGATLLGHLQRLTGASCRNPLGTQALAQLKERVLGRDAPGQILVLPGGLNQPVYLPGGIILLTQQMVEGTSDPSVIAGYVLAAALSRTEADPLEPVLADAGFGTTLRLLTTGDIPTDALQNYATKLVISPPPRAGADVLGPGFETAQVPLAPYAYALDPSGETVIDLIEADRLSNQDLPIILTDGEWVSLQNICQI
ncbi:hypothetical protein [Flavimaricola marinus]|uniref:Uncharacterized protein n=1 Tax=Flavimaricola marinus TaxID=1819565 RepID=A0A238LGJ9_9RHOB|nr:hypothetical protein [Flavimaricola marinus]SMY08771.1 hypothetical protein LOM8899_02927 [Flavimaricola marinus]